MPKRAIPSAPRGALPTAASDAPSPHMLLDALRPEVRKKLNTFAALLLRWNQTINLIGRADEPVVWQRHIADSLQLADHVPAAADTFVDLGSGGGFPGLILAIATGAHAHLIEADHRKAAFLREAVMATGTSATVHPKRIEDADIGRTTLVTARALAPLTKLLPWAAKFMAEDGTCLFLKGAQAEAELTAVAGEWQMDVQRIPSRTAPDAVILRITGLRRARSEP